MRRSSFFALTSVSLTALVTATSAIAQAPQPGPVTSSEAEACAKLPTPQERALCIQGQAKPEGSPDDAGELATQPAEDVAANKADSEAIVVTGSRIRSAFGSNPDPITVINPDLERKGGENDTAEILQTNPVAAGSFQITSLLSAGSFVTNGGVGAQTLSLRGLGAERTLVLVNGRRAGPAGTRGAIGGFDLNVIPSSVIQSVEILKTGASSIYGSDAIAGVVNLLTKKATDGIEMRGFVSAPIEGGGENYNINVSYGKQFSRGHIIAGVDYAHRNEFERGDRDYLMCPEEYLFNPAGARVDIIDPRTGEPRCNAFFANALNISGQTLQPGVTYGRIDFNDPGDRLNEFLIPATNTATFALPAGFFPLNFTCTAAALANPATATLCRNSLGVVNEGRQYVQSASVAPELDRYTVFADGSFDITDNVKLVGELLYNKRKTHTEGVRQLFFSQFSGQTLGTTSTARPAFQCTPGRIAANPNCDPTSTGDPFNNGFVGNFFLTPVVPVFTYQDIEVDYYRAVGGVKADLGGILPTWRLDSYVQHSRSDGDYTQHRILDDAVDLQEFRSRACQPGQVTRVRGVPCMDLDFTNPRILAGDFTPAEQEYLFGEETGNTLYTQWTAEASIAGTAFTLPAGEAGVALGVQWRRDEIDDTPGDITTSGNVWGQSVSGRTAGHATSHEAFGEIQLPLIHNTPFIQNLTLSAAARVTNNRAERDDGVSDSDKGNWTYKLGGNWQVNDWLRFRGTLGTSFRAPALFEQFLADQTGFLGQASVDPCIDYRFREEGDRIFQRCAALGLPLTYSSAGTSSALITTQGGIGILEPETSKAKTLSIVLTPQRGLWEGMRFSVAVDYFDIEINKQLTTLGGTQVSACFQSDTYPQDPTCGLFVRQLNPQLPRFGEIITIEDPFINIASQRNRGVDLTTRVTQDLGSWGNFAALAQMTWQIDDKFELFEGFVTDDNGESGEPIWVGDFKFTWDKGPWSTFYGLNVIGGTSDEQDTRNAFVGGDLCTNSPVRGGLTCPVYRLKPQFYHSASVTREVGKRYSMTIGINNLFDKKPPRVSGLNSLISGIGQAPVFGTQYDLLGRRAFISVRAKM